MTSDLDARYGTGVEDTQDTLDWYGNHVMYTSYLVASPRIVWWRSVADQDTITVDWRHPVESTLACTVPRHGRASVSTELFLRAVEEFDRQLIDAMDRRITQIEAGMLDPDIQVDIEQLRQEHQQRSESLAAVLNHIPATDWTAVRESAARIFTARTHNPPSLCATSGMSGRIVMPDSVLRRLRRWAYPAYTADTVGNWELAGTTVGDGGTTRLLRRDGRVDQRHHWR